MPFDDVHDLFKDQQDSVVFLEELVKMALLDPDESRRNNGILGMSTMLHKMLRKGYAENNHILIEVETPGGAQATWYVCNLPGEYCGFPYDIHPFTTGPG